MRLFQNFVTATLLVAIAVAQTAHAGVAFKATTRSESPGLNFAQLANATVNGWADGDIGKIAFLGAHGDTIPEGSALITTDGGKNVRFFDSVRNICSPWTGDAVVGRSANPLELQKSVSDLEITKALDEAGPEIAGFATHHYRFTIAYTSSFSSATAEFRSKNTLVEEFWTTEELQDTALRIWLDKNTWPSGNQAADQKISAALAAAPGVPLKRVSTLSARSQSGRELTTTVTLEVNKIEMHDELPASTFTEPFRCIGDATGGPN
ncbi:MAG: hypothetical protein ACR2QZ_12370 [Woeseiaceae bacterium]